VRARVVAPFLLTAAALCAAGWVMGRSPDVSVTFEADVAEGASLADDAGSGTLAARSQGAVVLAPSRGAAGRVEGEVRHAGKPASARVMLFEVSAAAALTDPDWAPDPLAPLVPTQAFLDAEPVASTEAGPDGRFGFDRVETGIYDVVAIGDSGARAAGRARLACAGERVVVHLSLRGGGRFELHGHAVHADGRPFHGYALPVPALDYDQAFPRAASPVPIDEEGRFTLTGLDRGPISVLVYVPGALAVRSHVVVLPTPTTLELVVDAGMHEVVGRVVSDQDGAPIAGATVATSVWPTGGLAHLESRALTDGDGRFRVLAPTGFTDYAVEAAGYARLEISRWLPEGDGFEFRLARTGRVVGRVLAKADGSPVEGVPVYARTSDGTREHATSGADGRYELASLAPGEVLVVAFGEGWVIDGFERANGRFSPFAIELEPGATVTVDLHVARAASAKGKVVDAAGKPVAGAQVTWERKLPGGDNDSELGFLGSAQAVATQADGTFTVAALMPGCVHTFHATGPERSSGVSESIRVEADRPATVEIHLGAARFADVTVHDRAGEPVAGIAVSASHQVNQNCWSCEQDALTDASGLARIGPLDPGVYTFGASNEAFGSVESPESGGPEGSTDPIHVELTVDRTHAVAGTVRYRDGTPVAGGSVEIAGGENSTRTEISESGEFRVTGLSDQPLELRVRLDWNSEPVEKIEVKAGDEAVRVVVAAEKRERLVVRVVDDDGRPVGGGSYILHQRWEGNSDEDNGSFNEGRLVLPPPRHDWFLLVYGARAQGGGAAPFGPAIVGPFAPATHEALVKLPAGRTIDGVVRAPGGGGVRGVRVAAAMKGLAEPYAEFHGEAASTRTDEAGRFRLTGLGAGTHTLGLTVGAPWRVAEPVDAEAGATGVVLTLVAGDSVHPIVVDADGRPVAGAYVKLTLNNVTVADADTDREGRASLDGLDAQKPHLLEITPPFTRNDVLRLVRKDWLPTSDTLALARGMSLAGVVRDADGRPVPEARVGVSAPGVDGQSTWTTINGTFHFSSLPEGKVSLAATVEGPPKRTSGPVTALAGSTDVTIALDRSATLTVHVNSPRGIPDDTYLRAEEDGAGSDTHWETLDEEGRATLTALKPEATYTLSTCLELEGGGTLVAIAKGVRADGRTVELTPVDGLRVTGRLRLPPGAARVRVWAETEGVSRSGVVDEDGRFVVEGVYAGACTVTAAARSATGERLSGSGKVEAGGAVEIELVAEKSRSK